MHGGVGGAGRDCTRLGRVETSVGLATRLNVARQGCRDAVANAWYAWYARPDWTRR